MIEISKIIIIPSRFGRPIQSKKLVNKKKKKKKKTCRR